MIGKKDNKEEEEELDKIKAEARREAIQELKPELKEYYKQEELNKLKKSSATPQEKFGKFKDAFNLQGTSIGTTDKINQMLGKEAGQTKKKIKEPEDYI